MGTNEYIWPHDLQRWQVALLYNSQDIFPEFNNAIRIQKYLKPGGSIFLAHDAKRKCLPLFLERAKKDYHIAINKQVIQKDGQEIVIIINRLQSKG